MPTTGSRAHGARAFATATVAAALMIAPTASLGENAPVAGGDSAANIRLDSTSKAVLTRWVAGRTGTLTKMYIRVKVEGSQNCPYSGRRGYAGGTSGRLQATTHPVLPDGRPNTALVLRQETFTPCGRERGESVDLTMGFAVARGAEFATVVRNVDSNPSANYFSTNHLYSDAGLVGANSRNERNPNAADNLYGLDPREIVGWSTSGGGTWSLPGGPYGGNSGRAFLPTYIQEYADGGKAGQPFYWAESLPGDATMVYPNVPESWTISQLGAYTGAASSGSVRLYVNGVVRGQATLSGQGMLRAAIAPVAVPAGATVKVSTSGGLALKKLHADSVWEGILGLGSGYRMYLESSPKTATALYPLPMYGAAAPATAALAAPAPAPKSTKRCKIVRAKVFRKGKARTIKRKKCRSVKSKNKKRHRRSAHTRPRRAVPAAAVTSAARVSGESPT